jgi:homoserine kinase
MLVRREGPGGCGGDEPGGSRRGEGRRPPRGISVFAPASVANFGVGFDALGAALDGPGDVVTARLVETPGVRISSIEGDGGRLPREARRNTAGAAAIAVLEEFAGRGRFGFELSIAKGLPLASGLGSSAASAAAGAWAAALLIGLTDKRKLLRAVLVAEHAADGAWHGDNVFPALLGGLQLVPGSDPEHPLAPVGLPGPARLRLVLVRPELEVATRDSRRVLPRRVPLRDHVRNAAAFAGLVVALAAGDLAAAGRYVSSDVVVEPARAPLVPAYAAVRSAMERAGALGVALAGAGPSLLALCTSGAAPSRVAGAGVTAFLQAGVAATARVHRVDARGARVVRRLP